MTNEQAIKILSNATFSDEWQGNEDLTTAYLMAIEALEVKKGKWIRITKNTANNQMWNCSECGRTVEKATVLDPDIFFPFCHCGADMREADE